MTSTIELERLLTPSDLRGRRPWAIAVGVVAGFAALVATAAGVYVWTRAGNDPLPDGVHPVRVYTVDEAVSTTVAPADRPGAIGRFAGMCDADTYYLEVGGEGMCLALNGSLGEVRARGADGAAELDATEAAKVRDIVRSADAGSPRRSTRVVLGHDGGWAGLVEVAALDAGGPVTAGAVG